MVDVKTKTELEKFRNYTRILEQWIALKQINISFGSWFEENNFHKIAVYGLGRIGQLFLNELMNSNVEICYGIDKGQIAGIPKVKVVNPEAEFDEVDLVVVTAMAGFHEIKSLINAKVHCPVVSLEDIIYELY